MMEYKYLPRAHLLLVTAPSLVTTQLILMMLMLWYGSANVVAVESQGIIWAALIQMNSVNQNSPFLSVSVKYCQQKTMEENENIVGLEH